MCKQNEEELVAQESVAVDVDDLIDEACSLMDDGKLFRFWVYMASYHPCEIARAIAKCTTESEYRKALSELQNDFIFPMESTYEV